MPACFSGESTRGTRRGWWASAVRTLSSSHVLQPLISVFCLAAVVIYGLAEKLQNFVVGIFVPQYHFSYPVALCFGQVVVSLSVLNLLHIAGLVPLQRYSRALGERLLLPSICSSVQDVLLMWLKAGGSFSGLLLLTIPLLPLVTGGFGLGLKLASPPSVHTSVMISILGGTSIVLTASKGFPHIEFLEFIYAPLALLLHALSLTLLGKVSETERQRSPDSQTSTFDLYYTQLVNQSLVLGLLWLLHPDTLWRVLSQGSWNSLLFNGYLHAILLLGTGRNFLVGMTALCISPLAAATLHSARLLVQPFLLLL